MVVVGGFIFGRGRGGGELGSLEKFRRGKLVQLRASRPQLRRVLFHTVVFTTSACMEHLFIPQQQQCTFFLLITNRMSHKIMKSVQYQASVYRFKLRREKDGQKEASSFTRPEKRPETKGAGRARGHASREADRASEALPSTSP